MHLTNSEGGCHKFRVDSKLESTGAPEDQDIEVTPAMLEAGLPHLYSFSAEYSNDALTLERLFRAMWLASLPPACMPTARRLAL
jgi:hypothetical protein